MPAVAIRRHQAKQARCGQLNAERAALDALVGPRGELRVIAITLPHVAVDRLDKRYSAVQVGVGKTDG